MKDSLEGGQLRPRGAPPLMLVVWPCFAVAMSFIWDLGHNSFTLAATLADLTGFWSVTFIVVGTLFFALVSWRQDRGGDHWHHWHMLGGVESPMGFSGIYDKKCCICGDEKEVFQA